MGLLDRFFRKDRSPAEPIEPPIGYADICMLSALRRFILTNERSRKRPAPQTGHVAAQFKQRANYTPLHNPFCGVESK